MADISAWSPLDESNTASPPNGWPEGMQPSGVNNSARAMMGATRRFYDNLANGSFVFSSITCSGIITGGTVNSTGGMNVAGTLTGAAVSVVTLTGGTVNSTGNINAAGTITGDTVNSNGDMNVAGTLRGNQIISNGDMSAVGTFTGGVVNSTGSITAGLDVNVGRNLGVQGTAYAVGVDCSGRVNAAYYQCDGNTVIDTGGGATVLYKGGNASGILLYNAVTYYDNNSHTFRNSGGSNTFTIDASGNVNATAQVQGASLYSRAGISAVGDISTSGILSGARLQGGPGGAGQLRMYGTNNSINFVWDTAGTGQLSYRVDESVQKLIGATDNVLDTQYAYPGGGPTNAVMGGHDFPGTWYYSFIDYTSDERIKTNIAPSQIDALAVLQQVPVDQFDIKPEVVATFRRLRGIQGREVAGSDHIAIGLVAQRLQALIPEAVYVGPQPGDNPLPADCHNITLPALVPYLVRAVQQLAARLEVLERER
jgi:hypothetical protein